MSDYNDTYSVQYDTGKGWHQVRVFVSKQAALACAHALAVRPEHLIVEHFSDGNISRGVIFDNRKIRAEHGL